MKLCSQNQSQIVFEVSVSSPDGTPKTNVNSSTVRVYQIQSGSEVDILASTSLSQVGSSNVYRYIWEPTTLAIGEYFVEYYFSDLDSKEIRTVEDLIVLNTPTAEDFATILAVETGKWEIVNNQMIFYEEDDETELLRFNLFDADGNPTSTSAMKRVPV